jgi:phosphoglycolate phosphatase-like HAD superfamily hydrolase
MTDPKQVLTNLSVEKPFFIGIDSDGCVFDTMEIKQKECFCPNFIRFFNLQVVSKYARETWEFVNLYSQTRGCNRFQAVVQAIELLAQRPEVKARGANVPAIDELKEWIAAESKLGNPALTKLVSEKGTPFMKNLLDWSVSVNEDIEKMVFGMPPFPYVRESLDKMSAMADLMVVSQTPYEALHREWVENNMDGYLRLIAGQEYGTKTEHLKYAAVGKYPAERILMIGDAPGDFKAATSNGVLYYPINPGHEEASWERFYNEALDKFFEGTYKGNYENALIEEFNRYLPEQPSWNK